MTLCKLAAAVVALASLAGTPAQAKTGPRPMPNFNLATQPAARLSVPNTTRAFGSAAGVAKSPPLTRSYYVARDGWPRNGGFAAGTGRVSTLPPGTVIGRRGDTDGRYATLARNPARGTLGLDPMSDRAPMRHYRSTAPLTVVQGRVAPAWSAPGGGQQMRLPATVRDLQRNGQLQRTLRPGFSTAAKPGR
ncbi:MAG TPA: TNT domain-containing protein [Ramlibacter sp.]|nr:TNT domain-containing protein [Ramlibacter sp.]